MLMPVACRRPLKVIVPPQPSLTVTSDAYARIGELYGKLGLPTLIVQEGGYSLPAIAAASRAFVGAFRASHGVT